MVETAAMVEGLNMLAWLINWRHFVEQGKLLVQASQMGQIQLQAITKADAKRNWKSLVVTDSKSLFHVINGSSIDSVEKRAGLEILLCRDLVSTLQCQVRWVPHEENIADSLTKLGAHHDSLLRAMNRSCIRLLPEQIVLDERKKYRESSGKACPRLKSISLSAFVESLTIPCRQMQSQGKEILRGVNLSHT
eukprot:2579118-Amphidinium_carterae.1